jgi:hypothetical protein
MKTSTEIVADIKADLDGDYQEQLEALAEVQEQRVAEIMRHYNVNRESAEAMRDVELVYSDCDNTDFDDEFNDEGIEDHLDPHSRKWERLAAPMRWEKKF